MFTPGSHLPNLRQEMNRIHPVYITSRSITSYCVDSFIQLVPEQSFWQPALKLWPHAWVHVKFRCGSSHQHTREREREKWFQNKEQPVDETKYSFYWLLISRSDHISVGSGAAETDVRKMKRKHTIALMCTHTRQKTSDVTLIHIFSCYILSLLPDWCKTRLTYNYNYLGCSVVIATTGSNTGDLKVRMKNSLNKRIATHYRLTFKMAVLGQKQHLNLSSTFNDNRASNKVSLSVHLSRFEQRLVELWGGLNQEQWWNLSCQ